ncbi:MAG: tail fiber domain-containing protein, partial [Nitrosarchaeum sp.]|nr:tail fiber domain-containing protein [Nitrosarchaeum sp.]
TIVSQLNPKSFYFDTTNTFNLRLSSQKQYGFVAQDVETILPELVYNTQKPAEIDSAGNITVPVANYKSLNYQAFIGILVGAVQAQQAQIDSLMNNSVRIQSSNQNLPTQEAILASKNCMLFQNTPNPFGESTSISYYLPDAAANAEMVFYDMYGSEIHRLQLQNKGMAKVDLTTKDLASGIYSYSLIADGKVIDTMKMVRVK